MDSAPRIGVSSGTTSLVSTSTELSPSGASGVDAYAHALTTGAMSQRSSRELNVKQVLSMSAMISSSSRADEETAAALVALYESSAIEDDSYPTLRTGSESLGPEEKLMPPKRRRGRPDIEDLCPRRPTKSNSKTTTSWCFECKTEQTSHFRPVVSDFVSRN